MNNDLDHESVSCLWPHPPSAERHMTAVVLSSDTLARHMAKGAYVIALQWWHSCVRRYKHVVFLL